MKLLLNKKKMNPDKVPVWNTGHLHHIPYKGNFESFNAEIIKFAPMK
jgi:hypothetical protein